MLALVLIASVTALAGAAQVRFADGARDIFVSDSEKFERYSQHVKEFPQSDAAILMVAQSPKPFTRRQLAQLRDFALDGQLIEGVDSGISIFSQQILDASTGEYRNLIADNLDTYPEIKTVLEEARSSRLQLVPLLNEDLTSTVILFSVKEKMINVEKMGSVIDEFHDLTDRVEASGDMQIEMTGLLPVRHHIVSLMAEEQIALNLLGGLLGSLVSLILFRSIWVGALNGIAPFFALLLTFGIFGWAGIEMNVISNSITVLILVLAMADCVHMTHELRKNAASGMGRKEAIGCMLQSMGPPCILTSITTMLALASLFYSDSALIHNFSIAGLIGLSMVLVSVIVIHPLVYAIAWNFPSIEKALSNKTLPQQKWAHGFGQVTHWLLGKKFAVALISVFAALILLTQFLPVQTNYSYGEYLRDDDPMLVAMEKTEAIVGPSQSLDIVLRSPDSKNLISNQNLDDLAKAHTAIEQSNPSQTVVSLHSIRRILSLDDTKAGPQEIKDFLDLLGPREKAEWIGNDQQAFRIKMMIGDRPSAEVRAMEKRIDTRLAKTELVNLRVEPTTGLLALAANLSDQMIRELAVSFLIAAVACTLLIAIWFRQWRFGLASILPNVIPILIVGAYLMHSDRQLQFISAIAFSIAFGVAVDDTIHVLNRLHIESAKRIKSLSLKDLPAVMHHVAPALVTTTMVLAFGLSSALFSNLPSATFFGILCVVIFLLALMADLFMLLPIIAALGLKKIPARR
ncbi:MAG: MMPL family transporter [Sphingorhabdus sp.]